MLLSYMYTVQGNDVSSILLEFAFNFSDTNECVEQSPCDQNAQCTNSIGSFTCVCSNGYRGDGLTCTGLYTPCLLNIPT